MEHQHFHLKLPPKAKEEIKFWLDLDFKSHTQPIWRRTSMATIKLSSDASNESWGGTLDNLGKV